jgi:hypothetical protein
MLELLAFLRANGFKTFIVSGGGIEFMRPWAERVYGIPPEQVVGSSIKTKFEMRDGKPVLVRLPELNFNDDKAGKPVGINQHIGRRPIAAFGNSDGDREMLEYTQGGNGPQFMLLVLHDDAAREYAYGPAQGLPDVKLGAFTPVLYEQAMKDGWTVVSMKNDWKQVFAFEQRLVVPQSRPYSGNNDKPPNCGNGASTRCALSGYEQRSSQRRALRVSESRGVRDRTV